MEFRRRTEKNHKDTKAQRRRQNRHLAGGSTVRQYGKTFL